MIDGDVAFKAVDKKYVDDVVARSSEVPTLFKRSEIDNAIGSPSPGKLVMRNKSRTEEYLLHFTNEKQMGAFKDLFPNATFDGPTTIDYYPIW